jgi:cytochrome c5
MACLLGWSACSDDATRVDNGGEQEPSKPEVTATRDAGKSSGAAKDAGVKTLVDASLPSAALKKPMPCEVATIVGTHCGSCHGETPAGSPMSLTSATDFQAGKADGAAMHTVARERIASSNVAKRMPPAGYTALSADELATMQKWLDDGAPAGTDKCAVPVVDASTPELPPVIEDGDLECYRLLAHNGDGKSKYKVGVAQDAYINYVFSPPWKQTVYGIVLRSVVDNAKVLHHWLLFQDDVPGLPSGPQGEIGAHPTGQLLAGWAPGADPFDFRLTGADVGIELPTNTTYTVEFHYNSSDAAAEDASGVEVCAVKRKPANVAGLSWLGLDQLVIPSKQWVGTCRPVSQEPIHITGVWPHMHLKGRHMKATINRKDGTTEILHDEDFDFNYQRAWSKNVTLMPGDTITTVCDYTEPMSFGEATTAEMCYLFTMAYPRGALAGLDLWGAFAHGGSSCLGM